MVDHIIASDLDEQDRAMLRRQIAPVMQVKVRLRRVWLLRLCLKVATLLAWCRLPLSWVRAIGNLGLAAARVDCRDDRGRRLGRPQGLGMRMEIE